MVYQPVPLEQTATTQPNSIFAPVPVDYDGGPVMDAIAAAGFGTAGQVLTMNPAANGFVWTTPA